MDILYYKEEDLFFKINQSQKFVSSKMLSSKNVKDFIFQKNLWPLSLSDEELNWLNKNELVIPIHGDWLRVALEIESRATRLISWEKKSEAAFQNLDRYLKSESLYLVDKRIVKNMDQERLQADTFNGFECHFLLPKEFVEYINEIFRIKPTSKSIILMCGVDQQHILNELPKLLGSYNCSIQVCFLHPNGGNIFSPLFERNDNGCPKCFYDRWNLKNSHNSIFNDLNKNIYKNPRQEHQFEASKIEYFLRLATNKVLRTWAGEIESQSSYFFNDSKFAAEIEFLFPMYCCSGCREMLY